MASTTQRDSRFVGFKALSNRAGSQPTSLACLSSETRSSIVTGSRTIGNCCPTSGTCGFPTTCLGGTLFYDGSTRVCGKSSGCNSFTVLSTSADITQPSAVDFFCYQTLTTWPYPTLYITDPALQADVTTSNTASNTQSVASGSGSGGSSSKAWIAGAVVGPLAFLCMVGVGAYFFVAKRRRQKAAAAQPSNDTYLGGKPELDGGLRPDGGTNHTQKMDDVRHMSELPGHHPKEGLGMRQELSGMLSPAELTGLRPPAELTSNGADTSAVQPGLQTQTLHRQDYGTQPSSSPVYELDTQYRRRQEL